MSEFSKLNGYDVKDKKAIRTYNTVDSMISDTTLKEGQFIETLGYYEINDGGSGQYLVVNDNTLVADNGSIHELSNGLKAKLISNSINVKQFGAYGDNIHDDIISIQNAIDYVNTNNYKVVKVPKGVYLISKPILLYDYMNLVGEHRINTKIIKNTNTTELVYNVDSIIILAKNTNSDQNYTRGQTIENLALSSTNNSTYGIYSLTSAPYTLLKNLFIDDVDNGIYYNHGSWASEFNNINISNVDSGIVYKDTGTSTIMKNTFIQNSTNKAYDLNGLAYSNLENLCADNCTNIVYSFSYCSLVINGLGSESPNADNIILLSNSNIQINSPKIYTNNDDSDARVLEGSGSRLIINGGTIGGSTQETANGKLAVIGTNFYITFNKTIVRTKFLTRSVGSAYYNSIQIIDDKSNYIIAPSGTAPLTGIGDIMPSSDKDKSVENMNLLENPGGIFFNVYGDASIGANGNRDWMNSRKVGDLFINQAPDKTGIVMYQQITDPKTFELANTILSVEDTTTSTKTLSFTNLNLDSDGQLKQITIRENDRISSSSGGQAKIESVNYPDSKLIIKDITGTFNVGDTVTLLAKPNFRDARFREVQHLLKGKTSERILNPTVGIMYFDTTLNKPIWYKGSGKWIDSTGTEV